jgi:hypothetical protein
VADEKRLYEHYGLDYSQAESSTVLPEGPSTDERPRLKKYVGAPVPAEQEPATADAAPPAAAEEAPKAAGADSMAPRNLSDATASPLPPRKPTMLAAEPQRQAVQESKASKLRTAIPIALGGAIAGLIAVLAWRRRR